MEPRVIRSIWDDAALSMASSKLSSFDGGCHTKGKHAQVDPYFDTPIRLLPHYITVRKEIRAVSDGNSALQRAKPAKPAKPKSSFYHLERKDWNSASGISFLGSPILPKARQGNLKRRQDLCHAVRSPCVCVCACKPSIAKRALLRLKSSTRSTSSNADSMMRTAATSVWAVSLLLLLLLLLEDCCADISFRKQRLPQLIKVICGWSWPAEGDACGCGEEKVLEASTTWHLGEDHPVGIGNLLGSVNFHGLSREGFDSFDMFWRVQLFLFGEKTDGWGRCLGIGILDGCSNILRMVGKSWVLGSLREWGERREWG